MVVDGGGEEEGRDEREEYSSKFLDFDEGDDVGCEEERYVGDVDVDFFGGIGLYSLDIGVEVGGDFISLFWIKEFCILL